jgi:hypothetical protein
MRTYSDGTTTLFAALNIVEGNVIGPPHAAAPSSADS